MSAGIVERMNVVARETIQLEVQAENLSSLVTKFKPQETPKNQLINSICYEILGKIREAFDDDKALEQLKSHRKTLPEPEGIFYTDVEKSVELAIKKLNIQFKEPLPQSSQTIKTIYPRINSICTTIFSFFKI